MKKVLIGSALLLVATTLYLTVKRHTATPIKHSDPIMDIDTVQYHDEAYWDSLRVALGDSIVEDSTMCRH